MGMNNFVANVLNDALSELDFILWPAGKRLVFYYYTAVMGSVVFIFQTGSISAVKNKQHNLTLSESRTFTHYLLHGWENYIPQCKKY